MRDGSSLLLLFSSSRCSARDLVRLDPRLKPRPKSLGPAKARQTLVRVLPRLSGWPALCPTGRVGTTAAAQAFLPKFRVSALQVEVQSRSTPPSLSKTVPCLVPSSQGL